MTPELTAAVERARKHVMTPEEVFEQRVSFVYGGMSSKSTMTKDDVRAMLAKSQGTPGIPKGYVLVPREPTEAMIETCLTYLYVEAGQDVREDARKLWADVLDAALRHT